MKKILLFIFIPIYPLFSLEVRCNFEEVYQNSEFQQGVFFIKNDMLRYQYYKHDLFTIIAKNNKFYLVNNHSKSVQKLDEKTEYLETLMTIISDYPNINNVYRKNDTHIKIERGINNFVKRISIQSEELNLSINLMNCVFDKIDRKYFRHFNFEDYEG